MYSKTNKPVDVKTPIKKFVSLFEKNKIDGYLVTKDVNITYLSDFPSEDSWLLVTPKKSYYITDFRYILEARKGLKGITVKQYTTSIFATLFSLVKDLKIKNLGFDDQHISLALYKNFKKCCPKKVKLCAKNNLVEQLREVKTKREISYTKKALKIHFQALDYLKRVIKPGVSEREVFNRLEAFVKSKGVGFSFFPIIASGPNSCLPHAKVTNRLIRNNEVVLIDMGIDYKGYKSDLTRMFFLGKIPKLVRDVNSFVKEAQQRAIAKIRANAEASKVDDEARNYLAKKSLAKYFGHSLGHGVGLEIHESPRLSQQSTSILKENMIVTVEPAVYIPNKFGIRIEDMVLVTQEGCEVLSDR